MRVLSVVLINNRWKIDNISQADFDPHQISWEDIFDLGGDEQVEAYVEDLSVPVRW